MYGLISKLSNNLRFLLLVGQGEEIVHQAHSEHRDTRLFDKHCARPQEQTEQQEEGRSCGRETLPNTALLHTPERQGQAYFTPRRSIGH